MANLTLRGFFNQYEQVVQKATTDIAIKIAKGSLATMEQYHREVGRKEGLEQSAILIRDMLGQIEAAQEQEDGLPEMPGAGEGV